MQEKAERSNCLFSAVTRRKFLGTGCAAAFGLAAGGGVGKQKSEAAGRRLRLRTIYSLHSPVQKVPDWPNVGFDFRPAMDRFNTAIAKGCPEFDLVSTMASGPDDARKILEVDSRDRVDGYIVFQMNCWNRVIQTIAETGKPTLYVDFQYGGSGGFLVYTADMLRKNVANVGFVASTWLEDVVAAARMFEVFSATGSAAEFAAAVNRLRVERTPGPSLSPLKEDHLETLSPDETLRVARQWKVLAIGGNWPGLAPAIQEGLGIEALNVPFAELNDAWKAADKDDVLAVVDRWRKSAVKLAGVNRETLEASAAMYLAEKEVLRKYGARAVTINCLGGFYGGHIHAYPCLGFHELLNQGLVGGCECDLRSTATMILATVMTGGRPGFISDPVVDAGTRRVIYAHCVASNRVFGPAGPSNPFEILTHSEDRQGASVRSLLPPGFMTSTLEVAPERKAFLFHQGRAVENVPDDRACRTKLAVEPAGDLEKLFREWDRWGWHRVTYYGDLKQPVYALAERLGWEVIEET